MPTHHTLSPNPSTVHWGYLDAKIPPRLTIDSGDTVTIETVSGSLADVGDTSIMLPLGRYCERDCGLGSHDDYGHRHRWPCRHRADGAAARRRRGRGRAPALR
jgi:hypothetical protein